MRRWLLLIFLATIAIDWPQLPFNARGTDLAFIAAAVAILAARAPSWPPLNRLDAAIGLYLAGSLLSTIFSTDRTVSSVEMTRHLYLAVIYGVIVLAVREGLGRTVGTGLALSGSLLAVVGLVAIAIQAAFGIGTPRIGPVTTLPYIGETLRLVALTATAAMFACVLTMAAPFVLLHPVITLHRWRIVAAATVLLIAGAFTFSHAVAGLAVAVAVVMRPAIGSRPWRAAAAVAVVAIVLAANFAASIAIRSIGSAPYRDQSSYKYAVDGGRAEIAGVSVEYQTMSYLRLKQIAWQTFMSRPITGLGLDRFHSASEAAFQSGRLTEAYRVVDPHSTLPGRLAEAGLVGAVTLLALWFAAGAETIRLVGQPSPFGWAAVAAAAGLAGTLVNSVNVDVMNFRFVWVALGLVRGLRSLPRYHSTGSTAPNASVPLKLHGHAPR